MPKRRRVLKGVVLDDRQTEKLVKNYIGYSAHSVTSDRLTVRYDDDSEQRLISKAHVKLFDADYDVVEVKYEAFNYFRTLMVMCLLLMLVTSGVLTIAPEILCPALVNFVRRLLLDPAFTSS